MSKHDWILYEIWDAIKNPDNYVLNARKHHPVAWVTGIILWSIVGVLQALLWVLTIIPSKINKWVLGWRYL